MHTKIARAVALVGLTAPAPALAGNLKITILSATIDAKALPKKSRSRATMPYSDLTCFALPGLRRLGRSCGVQLAADGVAVLPTKPVPNRANVDPVVRLMIGDLEMRTYPIPSTLKPKWEYPAIFDEAELRKQPNAKFILYDWVSPEKSVALAQGTMELDRLLAPGVNKVKIGPALIEWKVEEREPGPVFYTYEVPADKQIADLARNAPTKQTTGEYVAVPVAEGEVVTIEALGEIQPNAKKYPDRYATADGVKTIASKVQYNQPGFRDGANHAALIMQLGTTSMMIGAKKTFTADNSGLMVLAINDLKTSDNGGAFVVKVTVDPPAPAAKRAATDSGPESMSPRVVQQFVDARAKQLEPCAAKAAGAAGTVTLEIALSPEGAPKVSVADAAGKLGAIGACMAEMAAKWDFPRPRAAVKVRYPMTFGG